MEVLASPCCEQSYHLQLSPRSYNFLHLSGEGNNCCFAVYWERNPLLGIECYTDVSLQYLLLTAFIAASSLFVRTNMKYSSPLELFQWNCWSVRIFSRSKCFLGIWIPSERFLGLWAECSFEIVDLCILIFESVDGSALGCFSLSEITPGEVQNKIRFLLNKKYPAVFFERARVLTLRSLVKLIFVSLKGSFPLVHHFLFVIMFFSSFCYCIVFCIIFSLCSCRRARSSVMQKNPKQPNMYLFLGSSKPMCIFINFGKFFTITFCSKTLLIFD